MANLIVDTSALLAYFDESEPDHAAVSAELDNSSDLLIVSPYVLAELDYLVATRYGADNELKVLDELTSGAWGLVCFEAEDLKQARGVVARYKDQSIGVADASNVVLAERYHTRTIVTLDHRHFDVIRTISGHRFTVVPASR